MRFAFEENLSPLGEKFDDEPNKWVVKITASVARFEGFHARLRSTGVSREDILWKEIDGSGGVKYIELTLPFDCFFTSSIHEAITFYIGNHGESPSPEEYMLRYWLNESMQMILKKTSQDVLLVSHGVLLNTISTVTKAIGRYPSIDELFRFFHKNSLNPTPRQLEQFISQLRLSEPQESKSSARSNIQKQPEESSSCFRIFCCWPPKKKKDMELDGYRRLESDPSPR